MKKVFLLILTGIFIIGCSKGIISEMGIAKLTENKWLLQDEKGDVISYNGEPVSLEFNKEGINYRASGFAGCNNYFSEVNMNENNIQFGETGSTMMACPNLDEESAYLDLLKLANNFDAKGNTLKLYKDKILLLNFRRK